MIMVVCGTQKFPLNRMLEELDRLIEQGRLTQEVFAQIGHSTYEPKRYCWTRFMTGAEFEEKIGACDLLLTHSGVGTILSGKKLDKPVLVYPRSTQYGEHVDDHQWQIAREFGKRELVLVCEDRDVLAERIAQCPSFRFHSISMGKNVQVDVIRDYLRQSQPTFKRGNVYGQTR